MDTKRGKNQFVEVPFKEVSSEVSKDLVRHAVEEIAHECDDIWSKHTQSDKDTAE